MTEGPAPIVITHRKRIEAPPSRVHDAVHRVTPRDAPLLRTLFAIRTLPARLLGKMEASDAEAPFFASAAEEGFVVLADEPGRRFTVGAVGKFWKAHPGFVNFDGPDAFARFADPGYVKVCLELTLEETPDGHTLLATKTTIRFTDASARRRFRPYWFIVRPGVGLVRRSLLAGIKRLAERPTVVLTAA